MNLFASKVFYSAQTHPQVYDWIRRVQDAGVAGFTSSYSTIRALSNFCYGMDANGLTSKIKTANCFAPENITASFTPLYANYGSSSWKSFNFVPSDLSIHGLVGASGKFLHTGLIPSTAMTNTASGGLTIYVSVGKTEAASDLGGFGAAYTTNTMLIYADYSDGFSYFDCYGAGAGAGRLSVSNPAWSGFLSGNRYARTASFIARGNNNTYGLQTLVTGTGASDQGLLPTPLCCFGALQNGLPNTSYWTTRRISFAAVHEGYTPAECANFFTLVHRMRMDMGGGWI